MTTQPETNDFAQQLKEAGAAIESMLERLLAAAPLAGEVARPARLLAAMRHGALAGGKRLRPFLTIETAKALGVDGDGPRRAGAAIELVHCYSLIHDDLPAMDDDDLRRGRPTVHKAFDEATAILAGDALLTLAFDVMGEVATHADGAIRAALCVGLSRAAGLGGMAGGQMLDLEAESAAAPLDRDAILRLQAMKTGALLSFSVDAGAIIAAAPPPARVALSRYGRALGAAFQIADDILDAEGDEAKLGKRAGKDAGRNKATFVAAFGLKGAKTARDRLVLEAAAALDEAKLGAKGDTLRAAARFVAARAN
jgi:farnesyl diphosphate synthase